jgi:hypothetical protein
MTNIFSIVSDTKQIVITINAIWATGLMLILLVAFIYKFLICDE